MKRINLIILVATFLFFNAIIGYSELLGLSEVTELECNPPSPSIFGASDVCSNASYSYVMPSAPVGSSFAWSTDPVLPITVKKDIIQGDRIVVDFVGVTETVTITVVMTDQFGCNGAASMKVGVIPDVTPSFEINEPSGCEGERLTFELSNIIPMSLNNKYKWFLNDPMSTPLQASSQTTFETSSLISGDRIIVEMELDPEISCVSPLTPNSSLVEWSSPNITDLCVGLDHENLNQISAYPNPVSGKILHFAEILTRVTVLTIEGEEVLGREKASSLDVSDLSPGVYILNSTQGILQFMKE